MVTYRIHPDPRFERQGLHLFSEHCVNIWTLIAGGKTTIKDLEGNTLEITVPARTQPGSMIRLRGKGLNGRANDQGDMLVKIQAMIPEIIDAELLALIEKNSQ